LWGLVRIFRGEAWLRAFRVEGMAVVECKVVVEGSGVGVTEWE
jgi:hypothetical protein